MPLAKSLRPADGPPGPQWEGRAGPKEGTAVGTVDVAFLLQFLWRRKLEILLTVAFVIALSALLIGQIRPTYSAASTVMIEGRMSQVVDIDSVMSGLPSDAETIQSEIEVIRSRSLAGKVAEKLRLDMDPEFNRSLRGPGAKEQIAAFSRVFPEAWASLLGSGQEKPVQADRKGETGVWPRVVEALLGRITVDSLGRSRVIKITVESGSARKAATIANTLAELYLVAQLESKFLATQRATSWLAERLESLRANVAASEMAVEAHRRSSGIVQGRNVNLTTEQISELGAQLVTERARRVEAEARLQQVRTLLASAGGAQSLPEVLTSNLIVRLREQEAEVKRKVAELSEQHGEKHPRMINARAELLDLENKIAKEVDLIVEGLRNEVQVARAREASMQESLNALKTEAAEAGNAEVELRALEREAEANRTLLETFLSRSKETESQESYLEADATIVSPAAVPENPSAPRKTLLLALAALAGVGLGIALAAFLEMFDKGIRSQEQVEADLGVRALGLLPALGGLRRLTKAPDQYLLENPISAYAEAVRSLHTALAFNSAGQPPSSVLITSSLPREGKTASALSLANLLGKLGKDVIVLDCDLRHPSIHRSQHEPLAPGLNELLSGVAPLDAVVRKLGASGADYIAAGAP